MNQLSDSWRVLIKTRFQVSTKYSEELVKPSEDWVEFIGDYFSLR